MACGVLDSDGNSFSPSTTVLDSDGNAFVVSTSALDSDGNAFSVCVDVGPITVTGGGIGHGGFARKPRRLVKVEEAESPEEVIAEIDRAFSETTKKPVKKRAQAKVSPKPVETPSVDPDAWLDYFREQSRLVREQQMINDLLAQAKMRVQELQAQETLRRLEALQIQQEEEVLLLLMAA